MRRVHWTYKYKYIWEWNCKLTCVRFKSVQLPNELSDYQEAFEKHDAALYVSENCRGQGKASQLLGLMFKYLEQRGIKDLKYEGITDDIAMKTYLNIEVEALENKEFIIFIFSFLLYKNINLWKKIMIYDTRYT